MLWPTCIDPLPRKFSDAGLALLLTLLPNVMPPEQSLSWSREQPKSPCSTAVYGLAPTTFLDYLGDLQC